MPLVVEGVRTAVHDAGAGDDVVLVHGNPGPMDDWAFVAPALAERFRVVAMDLPGFGRAARPRRFDYSVTGMATFLDRVLRARNVERAHFVAHDFGGIWAAAWARMNPTRVRSLTLIAAPLSTRFRWHKFARMWQLRGIGELFQLFSTRPLIRAVVARDNPRPLPAEFLDRVGQHADLAQKLAVLPMYRDVKDPRIAFAPLVEALRAIDPPACVIWGARDPYPPASTARDVAAIFSNVETHLVDGAGHWPFVDEPEEVRNIVLHFLSNLGTLPPPASIGRH